MRTILFLPEIPGESAIVRISFSLMVVAALFSISLLGYAVAGAGGAQPRYTDPVTETRLAQHESALGKMETQLVTLRDAAERDRIENAVLRGQLELLGKLVISGIALQAIQLIFNLTRASRSEKFFKRAERQLDESGG